MRARFARLALPALLGTLAGCLASSVVAPEERDAFLAPELAFGPYSGAPLEGLYGSISIEGDASLSLLKVYYCFQPGGTFAGAALLAGDPPAFQVLSGSWTLTDAGLVLGEGAAPARLEAAPDHLRLTGAEGAVVLRREETL